MTWESTYHAPVLAREVRELLGNAAHVLDGTLGGGGHTLSLLETGKRVSAVDRDPDAIREATDRLAPFLRTGQLDILQCNFADAADRLPPEVLFDGILLDLGVSSHQLDDEARGFSFRPGVPLTMQMGEDAERSAAEVLNDYSEFDLARVFKQLADEPRAARLAREVVRRRATRPFAISDDLVGAIRGALGPQTGPSDFARIFQGVRIEVNQELESLQRGLDRLRLRLKPGGRLVVISYHSGEDRVVKHTFQEWSKRCVCPPKHPMCTCRGRALGETVTRRSVEASADEVLHNPRARSARLRAWQNEA